MASVLSNSTYIHIYRERYRKTDRQRETKRHSDKVIQSRHALYFCFSISGPMPISETSISIKIKLVTCEL